MDLGFLKLLLRNQFSPLVERTAAPQMCMCPGGRKCAGLFACLCLQSSLCLAGRERCGAVLIPLFLIAFGTSRLLLMLFH